MTIRDLIRCRLESQRLVGARCDSPVDTIRWLGAVQAQDYQGARWGVALRTANSSADDIDRLFDAGAILRTHILRPTWHFVVPDDIRWMLALTSPRIHAVNGHYCRRLGLDAALLRRTNRILAGALRGNNHLTRTELAARLAANGIDVKGQPLGHVMLHAELDGVICSGPLRGKLFTYSLFDERVPAAEPRRRVDAVDELARRFVTSHGPATARDFAWWSGLTLTDARAGFDALVPAFSRTTVEGKTWWMSKDTVPAGRVPAIHMLPNYDEHFVAYRDRDGAFDAGVARRFAPTGDLLLAPVLTRDGQFIGNWGRTLTKEGATVTLSLLAKLEPRELKALENTVTSYRRFAAATPSAHASSMSGRSVRQRADVRLLR